MGGFRNATILHETAGWALWCQRVNGDFFNSHVGTGPTTRHLLSVLGQILLDFSRYLLENRVWRKKYSWLKMRL
jgi:hypothetical protein